jgi:hypothetical protein
MGRGFGPYGDFKINEYDLSNTCVNLELLHNVELY